MGKHHDEEGILHVPAEEAAAAGRLGAMRNLGVRRARHENIVILDDHILLTSTWYGNFLNYGDDFDILTSRILLRDGTRYWDCVTYGGPRRHRMLRDDEEPDDSMYMSGGCAWVMKNYVAQSVQWEEHLSFYQGEDVKFSRRCVERWFRISHNRLSVAYHLDPAYTRVGRCIMKRRPGVDHLWLLSRPETLDPAALFRLVLERKAANQIAELADCLRTGMELHPRYKHFSRAWAALQRKFLGDAGGDRWHLNGDPELKQLVAALSGDEAEASHTMGTVLASSTL